MFTSGRTPPPRPLATEWLSGFTLCVPQTGCGPSGSSLKLAHPVGNNTPSSNEPPPVPFCLPCPSFPVQVPLGGLGPLLVWWPMVTLPVCGLSLS